ncbi:MAG TPA: hypothetical protein VGK57_05355, partial [Candidatus Binatia bacterium]
RSSNWPRKDSSRNSIRGDGPLESVQTVQAVQNVQAVSKSGTETTNEKACHDVAESFNQTRQIFRGMLSLDSRKYVLAG